MPELILMQPSCDVTMMRTYVAAGWHNILFNLELEPLSDADVVTAATVLSSAGGTPIVKLPNLDPEGYARYLHFGVRTLVLPHVSTAASVIAIRERLKEVHWVDQASIRLIPLVESKAGLSEIPQICAIANVAAVMLGPFDLAHDLGFPVHSLDEFDAIGPELAPIILDTLKTIRNCGKQNGLGLTPAWYKYVPMDRIDWLWLQLNHVLSAGMQRMSEPRLA